MKPNHLLKRLDLRRCDAGSRDTAITCPAVDGSPQLTISGQALSAAAPGTVPGRPGSAVMPGQPGPGRAKNEPRRRVTQRSNAAALQKWRWRGTLETILPPGLAQAPFGSSQIGCGPVLGVITGFMQLTFALSMKYACMCQLKFTVEHWFDNSFSALNFITDVVIFSIGVRSLS